MSRRRHFVRAARLLFAIGAMSAAVCVAPALAQAPRVVFAIPCSDTLKKVNIPMSPQLEELFRVQGLPSD